MASIEGRGLVKIRVCSREGVCGDGERMCWKVHNESE